MLKETFLRIHTKGILDVTSPHRPVATGAITRSPAGFPAVKNILLGGAIGEHYPDMQDSGRFLCKADLLVERSAY
ncbi:hypothetical protein ACMDCR_14640 [Labrys okinawensis]|uniref:hypothetical protein n=1 Tax=Labrys okinawensis TaxID=346911 RepID=UPI0039BC75FF